MDIVSAILKGIKAGLVSQMRFYAERIGILMYDRGEPFASVDAFWSFETAELEGGLWQPRGSTSAFLAAQKDGRTKQPLSAADVKELLDDEAFVQDLEKAIPAGIHQAFMWEQETDDEYRRSRGTVPPQVKGKAKRRLIREEFDRKVSRIWMVEDISKAESIRRGGLAYCRRRRGDIFDPPFRPDKLGRLYKTQAYSDSRSLEEIRSTYAAITARTIEESLRYFNACSMEEILKRLTKIGARWHQNLSEEEIRRQFNARLVDCRRKLISRLSVYGISGFGAVDGNGANLTEIFNNHFHGEFSFLNATFASIPAKRFFSSACLFPGRLFPVLP